MLLNYENKFTDVIYNYETFDPSKYGDESIKRVAKFKLLLSTPDSLQLAK